MTTNPSEKPSPPQGSASSVSKAVKLPPAASPAPRVSLMEEPGFLGKNRNWYCVLSALVILCAVPGGMWIRTVMQIRAAASEIASMETQHQSLRADLASKQRARLQYESEREHERQSVGLEVGQLPPISSLKDSVKAVALMFSDRIEKINFSVAPAPQRGFYTPAAYTVRVESFLSLSDVVDFAQELGHIPLVQVTGFQYGDERRQTSARPARSEQQDVLLQFSLSPGSAPAAMDDEMNMEPDQEETVLLTMELYGKAGQ